MTDPWYWTRALPQTREEYDRRAARAVAVNAAHVARGRVATARAREVAAVAWRVTLFRQAEQEQ